MPYKSEKQRAFMHIHHPKIASKWDVLYGSRVVPSKKSAKSKPAKKKSG